MAEYLHGWTRLCDLLQVDPRVKMRIATVLDEYVDERLAAMSTSEIWVRRQWNHSAPDERAKYRLADVKDVHWDWVSGGVWSASPQAFLYGYVQCDGMLEGDLAHSGQHGPCPHRIKVCIVKKDNASLLFSLLAARAGPKPRGRFAPTRP
jgi:hypothetical protein